MRTNRRREKPRAVMQAPEGRLAEATRLARDHLARTERLFSATKKRTGPAEGGAGRLWEHSRLVAGMARRLAEAEGKNGDEAYLAGLLHDAGKFAGGRYHEDEKPEEEASAAAAESLLERAGFGPRLAGRVARAIRALYRQGAKRDALADAVHDADFLTKSGRLGVAQFFIKSTLRGESLGRMAAEFLSRELTYASALPANMRTAAGRRLARSRAAETARYFRGLLRELEEARGLRFVVRRLRIDLPRPEAGRLPSESQAAPPGARTAAGTTSTQSKAAARRGDSKFRLKGKRSGTRAFREQTSHGTTRPAGLARLAPVTLVHTRFCERCGGKRRLAVSTEQGVKCERLEARLTCPSCGLEQQTSFCLPEIFRPRRPAASP